MSAIVGVKHWAVQLGKPIEPGEYLGVFKRLEPTDIPCPYCHEFLGRVVHDPLGGTLKRVGRVLGPLQADRRQRVIAHAVPRTHVLLGCRPCRQAFSVLKAIAREETKNE